MCSIIGVGERLHKVLGQIDLGTLDSGEQSLPFGLLVSLCSLFCIAHQVWTGMNTFGRLHYFLLIPWTLFHIFVQFPCLFHAGLIQTISKSPRKALKIYYVNVVYDISRHAGSDTGSGYQPAY